MTDYLDNLTNFADTMSNITLTRDMIAAPERWRLSMCLRKSMLEVLAWCPESPGESPVAATVPLTPGAAVTALEEAVYSHPLLLARYARTDLVIADDRFHILPPETGADPDVLDCLDDMLGGNHPATAVTPIDSRNSQISLIDHDIVRFVQRTFDACHIQGHIGVLGRFFARRARLGNSAKLYVNLHPSGTVDLLAFNALGLAAANSFMAPDDNDAIYYILAVADTVGLDLENDELHIGGDPARRGVLIPLLTGYAANVVPLIVPSPAWRPAAGTYTPLELIILPLTN